VRVLLLLLLLLHLLLLRLLLLHLLHLLLLRLLLSAPPPLKVKPRTTRQPPSPRSQRTYKYIPDLTYGAATNPTEPAQPAYLPKEPSTYICLAY
jgi:hypothetical protein